MGRFLSLFIAGSLAGIGLAQNQANWKLADKFNTAALRPYIYSSRVVPNFLKDSDAFWYVWREASGKRFMYVDPAKRVKEPLFDPIKMAAQLSELHEKPYDAIALPFDTVTMTEPSKFYINVENKWYLYDRAKEHLEKSEKGPDTPKPEPRDYKNKAKDGKIYVYAQDDNLYVNEGDKDDTAFQITFDGEENYSFGRGGRGGGGRNRGNQQQDDTQNADNNGKTRPGATWSEDSKRFFISRFDSRKVKDLYLVNNLADPRPTLMTYKYAMPGEEYVPQQELWVFTRSTHQFKKLKTDRYKDQLLLDVHFPGNSDHVRFVRRDRLQRHLEVCDYDLNTDQIKVLLTEAVENAYLEIRPIKYVKDGGDFLWFSERTGWGHYYRYSYDGKLLNAVTSGPWRADGLTDVDADKGYAWVTGVGREPGEDLYYNHTYRVKLDGSDFRMLTPGNADHAVTLSTSKKFEIDAASRVDMAYTNAVWDDAGHKVLDLEKQDLSRLEAMGWKMPETFTVKSDDGVVDIYGNMWKPFDFDPKKKYPIILYVYPGPQTEAVNDTFNPVTSQMTLAQLGFIVIQIGNRGGSPQRSNAYHSYGYYNLRDYGLADKKAGVEQLASKYPWIDIDRVGIYGHSGGGFMTAAAMLLPPYNEFFKVGVSSSGNHDNNIYNSNWSEQHHGLKVVTSIFDDGSGSKKPSPEEAWVSDVTTDPLDSMLFEQNQKQGDQKKDDTKKDDQKKGDTKKTGDDQKNIKFEIKVPTTVELAANLQGSLLLVTGDVDNNVHPANTIRLVNALIKANKRFDFMIMPGQAHGYGPMQSYFQDRLMEYFAQHLLGDDYAKSAEMKDKGKGGR
ncbi:MAG: prolyl oligopeptidase family serine peptidase [Armatimonadetes bacterium]|nr:prolyl oligopeptidase family serine peptidase [Armatimonadota bacterium]